MAKFFEIFKAGTRTDNSGRTVTITEADVAQAAAAYDPALHEAPLVIGHPKTMHRPMAGWAVCKPMVVCCQPILRKWTMILSVLYKAAATKSVGQFLSARQPE